MWRPDSVTGKRVHLVINPSKAYKLFKITVAVLEDQQAIEVSIQCKTSNQWATFLKTSTFPSQEALAVVFC